MGTILDFAKGLLAHSQSVWFYYQLGAITLSALLAYIVARYIKPRLRTYLENKEGMVAQFTFRELPQRIQSTLLLIILLIVTFTFQQLTWFSNSFFLVVASKLVAAWVFIRLFSIIAPNKFVFRLISITLWTIVAASVVGVLPRITAWLGDTTFSLGDADITLLSAVTAAFLLVILFWAVNQTSNLVERSLKRSADVSPSMQVLLSKMVRIILFISAVVITLRTVGIDLTAFAVFSGAIGVGIGFGLQSTVSNFISGISLLLDKSIKPGDVISVGDTFGWISSLNTRYTSVVTRDGREHLIPNADLITQPVVNWSFTNSKVRLEVAFGVSYDADPHLVKELVEAGVRQHARILAVPKPIAHLVEFGDSSINFVFRFWIGDPAEGLANIRSHVLFAIWDILKENKIEIPFPRRDLSLSGGLKVQIEEPVTKRPARRK